MEVLIIVFQKLISLMRESYFKPVIITTYDEAYGTLYIKSYGKI